MSEFTALGIDVGGTKIAAGLVTFPGGTVLARETIPTLPHRGGEAVSNDIERLARSLAGQPIAGIGLGVCEIVSKEGAIASHSLFPWPAGALRDRLASIAPVVVEADVRAAARAEALFGAGRGLDCFLYVSIGTGISSCLVIHGEPFVGSRGATGTLASGPFPGLGRENATLEQLASGPALVARGNALGLKVQSGAEVLAAAAAGDSQAREIVRFGAAALGSAIGWLINILDPHTVILGGGLGLSQGLFRDTLIESARHHVWWAGHCDLPIIEAQTGADAGLIGAAASAARNLKKS